MPGNRAGLPTNGGRLPTPRIAATSNHTMSVRLHRKLAAVPCLRQLLAAVSATRRTTGRFRIRLWIQVWCHGAFCKHSCRFVRLTILATAPMPTPGVRLQDLTWSEAQAALDTHTVIVIPLGASAKEHGPHLRLDNDWTLAPYLADRVLAASRVVMAPTVAISIILPLWSIRPLWSASRWMRPYAITIPAAEP